MKKTELYSILAAALLAVVAFLFFFPDAMEGNVLQQHDTMQGLANGQEGKAFFEQTGEHTRWTDSLFGGMPNFQIAPSYPANTILSWITTIYTLGLPSPANLLFAMMLGFFIMCLCMDMKWYTSLFASLAWGFSTYFIIIIGAGHIWKFITLAYIPPTIGGIALCYRKKYLAGTALAALFGAMQLNGNHPQMSYYFMFVIVAMMIAWLFTAISRHELKQWGIATGCVVAAGLLAGAANSASLYNTYEYSKETVRGKSTFLTSDDGNTQAAKGMDRDQITAWSYGIDETMSLLIPNIKGGANAKPVGGDMQPLTVAQTDKIEDLPLSQEEIYILNSFPQYFGDQPGTNGPVYVGAFVLMLAILAMFVAKGPVITPMKWALFAVSIFAIMLSWGHNFPALTNFMIDSFPGYNKFRAVTSILVVVEFCVPLLAAMSVAQMIKDPEFFTNNRFTTFAVMGFGAFICLIAWVAPSAFGNPFSAYELEMLQSQGVLSNPQYANLINGLRQARLSLVSNDALRSLIFILLGTAVLWLFLTRKIKNNTVFVCSLSFIVLIDLFSVNKRYVNSDNFVEPMADNSGFIATPADEIILRDKSNYRVLDLMGFSQARSSYFHHTIGGYHAAKLTRYNDLIDRNLTRDGWQYLLPSIAEYAETGNISDTQALNVLNMLNTKYIINTPVSDSIPVIVNKNALGNAWFVDAVSYVDDDNAEMKALESLDTRHKAVANKSYDKLLGTGITKVPGDTIFETSYSPNRLVYNSNSKNGGVAVFSEIYFPWGWTATIDGKPSEIARANYLLRAIRVPAGKHEIVFEFNPESLRITNSIAIAAVCLIFLLTASAAIFWFIRQRKGKDETADVKDDSKA